MSPDSGQGDDRRDKKQDRATPSAQHVHEREKEEFGGMKFGAAFFGWLTAVGATVLLVALVAGVGGAVGFATDTDPTQATAELTEQPQQAGVIGGVVLLALLLIAYFAGGYVAGRMARFSGAKQGVAVWLWAVIVAVVLAIVGAIAGSRFDVLSRIDGLPQIPLSSGELTAGAIVAAALVVVVTLGGAILGGLAGMRYHRKIDEFGRAHA